MEHLLFIDHKSKAFQKKPSLDEKNFNNAMHVINQINRENDNADLLRGFLEDAEHFKKIGYEEDNALFEKHIMEYNKNQPDPKKWLVPHVR